MADDRFIREGDQEAVVRMDIIARLSTLLLCNGCNDLHGSLTVCPEAFFVVFGIGKPRTDIGLTAREMQTVRTLRVSVF